MVLFLLMSSLSLFNLSPYTGKGSSHYFRADVLSVHTTHSGVLGTVQEVRIKLLDGPQKDQRITIQNVPAAGDSAAKRLPIGSQILLARDSTTGQQYSFVARWYMPGIGTLFIIMLTLVIVIGAWRGITSVFGLAVSIFILAAFVVPRIVEGQNAFVTCIEGAVLITFVSIYIAHGFTKRTTVAFMSSVATLGIIVGLTAFASYVTGTSEIITEENVGILYTAHPIDIAGMRSYCVARYLI
jgi:uncharacterized membrane protein